MHIACPGCAAAYDVPAILLVLPRTMRCAVCAHDWQTTAIDPHAAVPDSAPDLAPGAAPDTRADSAPATPEDYADEALPATAPVETLPASLPAANPAATPRRGARISGLMRGPAPALVGWVLSLGVLFIAGQATLEHRAGIVAIWPASQRLFLWLGLG